jgi:putative photosynthetic complex assembly protein 2
MSQFALPVLFALFVWWFGTGLVLCLVRIGPRKQSLVIVGATVVLMASAYELAATAGVKTMSGAYLAFSCAILAWCWLEITFLTGYVTGPRTSACPADASGWRRVGLAISAILYHELALLAFAAGIVVLTWQGANQVGAATFLILWIMRLSAKLNLFLGVPFLNDDLLPERLGHLKSYFSRRPINAFFPVAVTASTILATLLAVQALEARAEFGKTAFVLLATLVALAVLEHWFMVVPVPVRAIWEWSMGSRLADAQARPTASSRLHELTDDPEKLQLTWPIPRLVTVHRQTDISQSLARARSGEIHGL